MNVEKDISPIYRELLLSLSDETKLHVINLLQDSLLHKTDARNVEREPVKGKQPFFAPGTMEFINSISISGGKAVPEDMNDISSLLEAKYSA
jgi:hypothetical protein